MNPIVIVAAAAAAFYAGRWAERIVASALFGYRQRKIAFRLRQEWDRRPRAKIIKVGTLDTDARGVTQPIAWHMDGNTERGYVPEFWVGPDGCPVFGGYTFEELAEISKRKGEFET